MRGPTRAEEELTDRDCESMVQPPFVRMRTCASSTETRRSGPIRLKEAQDNQLHQTDGLLGILIN